MRPTSNQTHFGFVIVPILFAFLLTFLFWLLIKLILFLSSRKTKYPGLIMLLCSRKFRFELFLLCFTIFFFLSFIFSFILLLLFKRHS
ncbi:MAG: hypothetical protein MRECE_17c002 [Mycoplasmataceae bacterium CE_OT135]|nr:MAG: hypothetical protein MRECE_17c002 [Mycoplasmataceae bacterium CE_OT135]